MAEKDVNDRARDGTLPKDPAQETARAPKPHLRAVGAGDQDPVAQTERAILAGLLWAGTYQPGTIKSTIISDLVEPATFHQSTHSAIFDAIRSIEARDGTPDVHTVSSEIARKNVAYDLEKLVEAAVAPTDIKLRQWAELVRDAWLRRQAIATFTKLVSDAKSGRIPARDVIADAETEMVKLVERSAADSSIVTARQASAFAVQDLSSTEQLFMPTGMLRLDNMIGGLFFQDVSILAARTSLGKSALAGIWAQRIAEQQKDRAVMIATLEMSAKNYIQRLAARMAEVPLWKIRRRAMSPEEITKHIDALTYIQSLPIYFSDSNIQTCATIGGSAQRLQSRLSREGKRIGLIVIDHVHLVKADEEGSRLPRREQVAKISRWLRSLARTLNVHVLALAQVSRESDKQGKDTRPMLHHIYESDGLAQDPDNVFFLHRRRARDGTIETDGEIIVAKSRNDATGTQHVKVRAEFMQIVESEKPKRESKAKPPTVPTVPAPQRAPDDPQRLQPDRQHVQGFFDQFQDIGVEEP